MKTISLRSTGSITLLLVAATTAATGAHASSASYGTRLLHTFTMPASTDGLTSGKDGNLYGSMAWGGNNQSGALFRMTAGGAVTVLHSFDALSADGSNSGGATPHGALVQGSDGNFYGTTIAGGAHGGGTIFKLSSNGDLTTLYNFSAPASSNGLPNIDGDTANVPVALTSDGSIYGTTAQGGTYGRGTAWRLAADGSYSILYEFGAPLPTGVPGPSEPQSGLILGSDGKLYGTTQYGGSTEDVLGLGSAYQLTTTGQLSIIHWFSSVDGGRYPVGPLTEGTDGYFYGTTTDSSDLLPPHYTTPTIFKVSAGGQFTLLHMGDDQGPGAVGDIDGLNIMSGLVEGRDGNFYGTMTGGGEFNQGSVFRISPSGEFVTLYYFGDAANDGNYPGALTLGRNGNLYGVTLVGGRKNEGIAFSLPLPAPAGWGQGPQITVTASMSPSVISISKGESATLTWSSTNATECHVWDGITGHARRVVAASGSLTIAHKQPQVYYYAVDCDGNGKASDYSYIYLDVTQ